MLILGYKAYIYCNAFIVPPSALSVRIRFEKEIEKSILWFVYGYRVNEVRKHTCMEYFVLKQLTIL